MRYTKGHQSCTAPHTETDTHTHARAAVLPDPLGSFDFLSPSHVASSVIERPIKRLRASFPSTFSSQVPTTPMTCGNACKCCHNCGCRGKAVVSKPAPHFEGTAVMPDGQFKTIKLSDYKGKYLILYFYPLDFTFVCPSEILAFDKAVETLKSKNVELLGCSVDSHYTHHAWRARKVEEGGIGSISHPLLADITKKVASDYGVLLDTGVALRGLFLIDAEGVLRHAIINDLPLGRSVDEALRMVDALQFHEKHGDVCPANWKSGQRAMKATAEGVAEYLRETLKKTSA